MNGEDRPTYVVSYRSPLTRDIQNSSLPYKFKMLSTSLYDGTGDPQDHLDNYVELMNMRSVSDGGKCRCFALTLKDQAKTWYRSLRSNSVSSWGQLTQAFTSQFRVARRYTTPVSHLANIQQGENETLGSYLARFRRERTKVATTSDETVKILAIGGVRPHTPFWRDLQAKDCRTLDRFHEMAEKHLRVENAEKLTRKSSPEPGRSASNKRGERREEPRTNVVGSDRSGRDNKRARNDRDPFPLIPKFTNFTQLTIPYDQVYTTTRDKRVFTRPPQMRSERRRRDPNRYCLFHRDIGHDTADCQDLKNVVEDLVRKGHFREYVLQPPQQGQQLGGPVPDMHS